MLKRLRSIRGMAHILILPICIGTWAIGSMTVTKERREITKRNGKIIWCKMTNKGNDFCDVMYGK